MLKAVLANIGFIVTDALIVVELSVLFDASHITWVTLLSIYCATVVKNNSICVVIEALVEALFTLNTYVVNISFVAFIVTGKQIGRASCRERV